MAARGAILAFGAATLALSSPATAQVGGANVAIQQQTIDEIEAELAGLEAAARWDGDPCAKIHRGASKLDSRFAFSVWADHASPPGEFSSFPPEMVRGWRARVDRLLKICPDETGFIGDPYIFEPVQGGDHYRPNLGPASPVMTGLPPSPAASPLPKPPPDNAGPEELAAWWTSEIAAINKEFQRIEGLTNPFEISSANARLWYRFNRLDGLYQSRQGKPFPPALLESWRQRSKRLTDLNRKLRQEMFPRPSDAGSASQPAGEQQSSNPIPRALNPLNILGGGAQQQQTEGNSGNPIVEGIDILGGGNRQKAADRNVQNQNDSQTAPANAKRTKSKSRPKRDRQGDRCDRSKGQVPADCPNR